MAALATLMTRFCAGEDSWLARSNSKVSNPGTSGARDSNGKPRRNKHKRRNHSDNTEDTAVNAGFSGSKSGQRKKPFKRNNLGPSSLDRILDRPCQIHGTPGTPANHTNRECWVFKQAGRSGAKNKEKGSQSDDDDKEPRSSNTGGQKKFPPQIKTVNMINATHTPKWERMCTLKSPSHHICFVLSLCCATYHLFFKPPNLPCQPLTFFTLPRKPLLGYVTAFAQPL